DDPGLVSELAAAMIKGMQSAGVAATAKHFPGHGDTGSDSHHSAPVVLHPVRRLERVELPPFRAAVKAGSKLIMVAHMILPRFPGSGDAPATLSPAIVRALLRNRLRYSGVIATDAMNMRALDQGPGLAIEALAALRAGNDLVLVHHDLAQVETASQVLLQAIRRGFVSTEDVHASAARILA